MTNIAFYLHNGLIKDIDCTSILEGNPGIGGTEYLFYLITYGLQVSSNSNLHVTLLTSHECILPKDANYQKVLNINGAFEYCINNNIEILVVNYDIKNLKPNIFKKVDKRLKIIIWTHNVISQDLLTVIAKTSSIKKIVNVGREQLDLYRDHLAFKKSTYIYNSLPIKDKKFYLKNSIPFSKRDKEVTYLGCIVPIKGFHILAKAWPIILKSVPEAHLNVIGTGNVYGNINKLGKYGIAEENYEKQFMPYLTNGNGEILPSVTFYGNLGNEKNKILAKTKIGVPNPSGLSETFCLSAVEMELYGCKIVTKRHIGFIDTVPKQCGTLYNNEQELANIIINELNEDSHDYDSCYQYIYDNFRIEKILADWEDLLLNINNLSPTTPIVNKDYNYKRIREINRKIKSCIPFGYLLPTIDTYIKLCNTFLRTNIPILY